jgi:hypothetical protein
MCIVFEISKPFQIKPGFYRSSITIRFYWLWFAISWHPMREDEMISLAMNGKAYWGR